MRISIFGLGYVGSVSIGCLARNGHHVVGVDLNRTKVDFVNSGKAPIVEDEIDSIISKYHDTGSVSATDDSLYAVKQTDVSFICVGTPSTLTGHLDLTAIFNVSKEIARGISEKPTFHIVVIRSTVLPGTNEKVASLIEDVSAKRRNHDFCVVSNPEFLREGTAVRDYYDPPYTLVGSDNEHAIQTMRTIYSGIDAPFFVTSTKVAELIKYVSNAFHALKITFANEIGRLCKQLEVDSRELMGIFCKDTKLNISPYYLKPGFCYGGSCLPKDLKALHTIAHDLYLDTPVINSITRSNDSQKEFVLQQILRLNKNRIGFLGLSFKAGTDDLRNSAIIDIIEMLLGKGYQISIFDRNVRFSQLMGANKDYILKKIPFISRFICDEPQELVKSSQVIVVVNTENEFSNILETVPEDTIIYDLANVDFDGKDTRHNYCGIAW